jgi:superfamily I DNA/RNA helicase
MSVEDELLAATEKVLNSTSRKKLVIAGPGAGKTTLFRKLLEKQEGSRDKRLVITFVNNLKEDLERSLGELSVVYTLHGYCQFLLHKEESLRPGLTSEFICYPTLISIIKKDWAWLRGSGAPAFVAPMRNLDITDEDYDFYLSRSSYYDAVDFDDSVYRVYERLNAEPESVPKYDLVLIDEFQDFNKMEAGVIAALAGKNPITIAGDDDQALYSRLRAASWEYIRAHHADGEYEVFYLPFCMRCPKVIVEAVNAIIRKARALRALGGRIDKPYRYYEPKKGADSAAYPHIDLVRTSVQRAQANYFGKYVEQVIGAIPAAHAEEAVASNEPLVLVIGSKPYLPQIENYLIEAGLIKRGVSQELAGREKGLALIAENEDSNLGWRLILATGSEVTARDRVREAKEKNYALVDVFPETEKETILAEARATLEVEKPAVPGEGLAKVKLTSYEGAKGLSAQYVFLVGLHANEMPKNAEEIQDIEICKFLVGLTRTKKKCTLLTTGRFGQDIKAPSVFIGWISNASYNRVSVNAAYWA